MATSTGPIVAAAGVTLANELLFDEGPPDWNGAMRVVVAAGIVGAGLAVLENAAPALARGLAWTAFATIMLVKVGTQPSPSERLLTWWNEAKG